MGLRAGFPTSLPSRMASIPLGFSVTNKPTAPPFPQPGPALLALLPSPAPGVRPSRHAGPQSAACPFATRFSGPTRRPTPLFPPPPSLPLQLLIVFHCGRRLQENPQVARAKRKLFPISRKVQDKAGRKKPPTEGADDGRRGAEPQRRGRALWRAGLKQDPPPTTPRHRLDRSPGTAEARWLRCTACPRVPLKSTGSLSPVAPGHLLVRVGVGSLTC